MATASTKTKQVKLKEKAENRKRLDEIKGLAVRQGYVTEDQVVSLLGDDDDPEVQVEQMEEVHDMLNQLHIEVFASEEEAHERAKQLRKLEDKKSADALEGAAAAAGALRRPGAHVPARDGRVPLLTREGEVEIARRIEAGERQVVAALFRAGPRSSGDPHARPSGSRTSSSRSRTSSRWTRTPPPSRRLKRERAARAQDPRARLRRCRSATTRT